MLQYLSEPHSCLFVAMVMDCETKTKQTTYKYAGIFYMENVFLLYNYCNYFVSKAFDLHICSTFTGTFFIHEVFILFFLRQKSAMIFLILRNGQKMDC